MCSLLPLLLASLRSERSGFYFIPVSTRPSCSSRRRTASPCTRSCSRVRHKSASKAKAAAARPSPMHKANIARGGWGHMLTCSLLDSLCAPYCRRRLLPATTRLLHSCRCTHHSSPLRLHASATLHAGYCSRSISLDGLTRDCPGDPIGALSLFRLARPASVRPCFSMLAFRRLIRGCPCDQEGSHHDQAPSGTNRRRQEKGSSSFDGQRKRESEVSASGDGRVWMASAAALYSYTSASSSDLLRLNLPPGTVWRSLMHSAR